MTTITSLPVMSARPVPRSSAVLLQPATVDPSLRRPHCALRGPPVRFPLLCAQTCSPCRVSVPIKVEGVPGIAEGVGLDALEVEELGDALVIGAEQFLIDLGRTGAPSIGVKPCPSKNHDRRSAEHPLAYPVRGASQQRLHEPAADSPRASRSPRGSAPRRGPPRGREAPRSQAPDRRARAATQNCWHSLVQRDGGLGQSTPWPSRAPPARIARTSLVRARRTWIAAPNVAQRLRRPRGEVHSRSADRPAARAGLWPPSMAPPAWG